MSSLVRVTLFMALWFVVSNEAFAGPTGGPDQPPPCSGSSIAGPGPYVTYVYAFSPTNTPSGCRRVSPSSFTIDIIQSIYDSIAPHVTCGAGNQDTLLCQANPYTSDVSLTYNWSASGMIQITTGGINLGRRDVLISCLSRTGVTKGTLSLTVSNPIAGPSRPIYREITCTYP